MLRFPCDMNKLVQCNGIHCKFSDFHQAQFSVDSVFAHHVRVVPRLLFGD